MNNIITRIMTVIVTWTNNVTREYRIDRLIIGDTPMIDLATAFGKIIRFATVLQLISIYRNIYLLWFANTEDEILSRLIVCGATFYMSFSRNTISIQQKKYIDIASAILLMTINMYNIKIVDCLISSVYIYYLFATNSIDEYLTHKAYDIAWLALREQVSESIDVGLNMVNLRNNIVSNLRNIRDFAERLRNINMTPRQFLTELGVRLNDIEVTIHEINWAIECNTIRTRVHKYLIGILFIASYYHYKSVPIEIGILRFIINLILTSTYLWKLYIDNSFGLEVGILARIIEVKSIIKKCKAATKIGIRGLNIYETSGIYRIGLEDILEMVAYGEINDFTDIF
jgi:hypothetical protein